MKTSDKKAAGKTDGEVSVLLTISEMPQPDRAIAERLHAIIKENAPGLSARTWYGLPAYADADGKVVCFFRGTRKFKERYMTLGFNDAANLDEGAMWPVSFALKEMNESIETRIAALVRKAVR